MSGTKFERGQVVATPGALEAFRASWDDLLAYQPGISEWIGANSTGTTAAETDCRYRTAGESCPTIGSAAECESG